MRKLACLLLVAGVLPVGGPSFASDGYVGNSTPNMTRTGYGECLHTERWSEANAIAECDPEIVAARDAKSVAAMEVIVVKEMRRESNFVRNRVHSNLGEAMRFFRQNLRRMNKLSNPEPFHHLYRDYEGRWFPVQGESFDIVHGLRWDNLS